MVVRGARWNCFNQFPFFVIVSLLWVKWPLIVRQISREVLKLCWRLAGAEDRYDGPGRHTVRVITPDSIMLTGSSTTHTQDGGGDIIQTSEILSKLSLHTSHCSTLRSLISSDQSPSQSGPVLTFLIAREGGRGF